MTIKTYLDDPYLKEIKANLIKIEPGDKGYLVILDRTIFHPNSQDGQPRDIGTIDGIKVLDVYEEDNQIIHLLENKVYGDKVDLSIDWEHRFDLMQQHTGQHLLSANLYSLYNVKTNEFIFTEDSVAIEIEKESLSNIEVRQIEYLTNMMIQSNYKINTYISNKEDLSEMPIRDVSNPDLRDDIIRVVEIDGVDYCPCSGTHLNSTGELGLVKIKNWTSKNNKTIINFVCGNRALYDYSLKNESISKISNLLSTEENNIISKTKYIINKNRQMELEIEKLRTSLKKVSDHLNINIDEFLFTK